MTLADQHQNKRVELLDQSHHVHFKDLFSAPLKPLPNPSMLCDKLLVLLTFVLVHNL